MQINIEAIKEQIGHWLNGPDESLHMAATSLSALVAEVERLKRSRQNCENLYSELEEEALSLRAQADRLAGALKTIYRGAGVIDVAKVAREALEELNEK